MAINGAEGSPQFRRTKVCLSIFGVPKAGFFCEAATKDLLQNGKRDYSKKSRAYLVGILPTCMHFLGI